MPPRVTRPLLAIALLACAFVARAESLRLVAPADGVTLRGGSVAEVRWSAAQLPPDAEEWEAFLSIDGGRYYAFRVTPHLDIDLQSFTFVVPNVDTADARILIRAGNEQRETRFAPRGSFAIARDPNATLELPAALHFERGESARDGEAPVLAWTDGSRRGAGLTAESSTATPEPALIARVRVVAESDAALAPTIDEVPGVSFVETRRVANELRARAHGQAPASSHDVLLVCSRLNI